MIQFIIDCLKSLGTGLLLGVLFSFAKMPIPAPPVIQGIAGILGITLGYMIKGKIFG